MMDFHVGQKVVCVDDGFRTPPARITTVRPVVGTIYTIRAFTTHPAYSDDGPCVHLEEIVNPVGTYRSGVYEPCWFLTRFRPLRTTNIDVFLKMLEPQPVKELSHG